MEFSKRPSSSSPWQRFARKRWPLGKYSERSIYLAVSNTTESVVCDHIFILLAIGTIKIMRQVPGQIKNYKSINTVTNNEDAVHYPQEFLNSLFSSGLPPYKFTLTIIISIMLLRNLSPPSMCSGTRLFIKELKDNLIVAPIIIGPTAGQPAHIPRIPRIRWSSDLPIPFKRL